MDLCEKKIRRLPQTVTLYLVLYNTLQTLGYTFFIFLYPIGVTGELFTIYTALPHVKTSGVYSYPMPNIMNLAFNYHVFLVVVMLSYFPNYPCINWSVDPIVHYKTASSRPGSINTSLPCLRNAFKDILLVIVYNYPYYNSIKHFKDFYKPAFPNMVFCGPLDRSAGSSVMTVDIYRGVLGYECLGKAMRQHPGYEGYFYINDDVILNYWNFYDFDKSSIWQSPNVFTSTSMYGNIEDQWYWWRSPYGLPNCRQAYEHLTNVSLGNEALRILKENGNGSLRCYSGRSDVLYIPKKHAQTFSVLSFIFYNHRVFLEIAVPTILRIIERESNIRHLSGYYIPGDKTRARFSKRFCNENVLTLSIDIGLTTRNVDYNVISK
ncbi:hypothetical protein QZH41_002697 [Actinostola sp. cb2023]|nr:hypothetical protein QZH41_002697 [Actinostola sp. cb2023]